MEHIEGAESWQVEDAEDVISQPFAEFLGSIALRRAQEPATTPVCATQSDADHCRFFG